MSDLELVSCELINKGDLLSDMNFTDEELFRAIMDRRAKELMEDLINHYGDKYECDNK